MGSVEDLLSLLKIEDKPSVTMVNVKEQSNIPIEKVEIIPSRSDKKLQ